MWSSIPKSNCSYGRYAFHRNKSGDERINDQKRYWERIDEILRLFSGDITLTEILALPIPDLNMLVEARIKSMNKQKAGMEQVRQLEKMAKKGL